LYTRWIALWGTVPPSPGTRGVGNPIQGDGITVPAVARGEQAGPQPPLTSDCSAAVDVENKAPPPTTATS